LIFVLRADAMESDLQDLRARLEGLGFVVEQMSAMGRSVLGLSGDLDPTRLESVKQLRAHPAVADIHTTLRSYRLVARSSANESRSVWLGDLEIGGDAVVMMAGPCSVESKPQLFATAEALQKAGVSVLRGGAFKPSTSPYSFQGLGDAGLELLGEARQAFGLKVVTEVMDPRDVEKVSAVADLLQIGTRNMFNYDLLREVGRGTRPVLLKRGFSARIEEWLLAAETVATQGNDQIILCERGIRTFETATRNTLDLAAVPLLHELSRLPVVVDPSQGTGRRDLVAPMSLAALAAGADGLLVEVHPDPVEALKDGVQSLPLSDFLSWQPTFQRVARAVGRTLGPESRVR